MCIMVVKMEMDSLIGEWYFPFSFPLNFLG